MMNQAAVEALYSATFAEDYLDVVENMPNEMQRHLSRLREADLAQYREFWCDLDKLEKCQMGPARRAAGKRAVYSHEGQKRQISNAASRKQYL